MTLQHLKDWIETLSPKLLSYDLVGAEEENIDDDDTHIMRTYYDIEEIGIDEENDEILFISTSRGQNIL